MSTLPERIEIDAQWSRAQATASPQPVLYLDTVSATDFAQAYKQQTFDLLEAAPGRRLLDVGCGTGEDALALGRRVGPGGRVVGLDRNPAMVAEGARRAQVEKLGQVEFVKGDAHALEFPDASFDGARSDRVFQHLLEPAKALAEMVRVTRSGGRVLIGEPDWETLVVDTAEPGVTRRVVSYMSDKAVAHGRIGRELRALFLDAGLSSVSVLPGVLVLTDFVAADRIWGLQRHARRAQESGAIPAHEVDGWLADLQARHAAGRFFSAVLGFAVLGHKA